MTLMNSAKKSVLRLELGQLMTKGVLGAKRCFIGAIALQSSIVMADTSEFIKYGNSSTFIKDVSVIDGTGDSVKRHQDILMQDGKIAAIAK